MQSPFRTNLLHLPAREALRASLPQGPIPSDLQRLIDGLERTFQTIEAADRTFTEAELDFIDEAVKALTTNIELTNQILESRKPSSPS